MKNADTKALEKAKELINEYSREEFGTNACFADLTDIGIGFTTVTDMEIPIQITVNLTNFSINRYLDDIHIECRKYKTIEGLIKSELENLDFDSLISVGEDDLTRWAYKSMYNEVFVENKLASSLEKAKMLAKLIYKNWVAAWGPVGCDKNSAVWAALEAYEDMSGSYLNPTISEFNEIKESI